MSISPCWRAPVKQSVESVKTSSWKGFDLADNAGSRSVGAPERAAKTS